jgi:hypothetical protein
MSYVRLKEARTDFHTKLENRSGGYSVSYQIGDRRIVAESHLQEFLSLAERKAIVKTLD